MAPLCHPDSTLGPLPSLRLPGTLRAVLFEIDMHAGSARLRICPEKNDEIWQKRSTGQVAACATLPYSDANSLSSTREQRLAQWKDREYQPLRNAISCHLSLGTRYPSGDEFH